MHFNRGYLSISSVKGVPVLFHWSLFLWLPIYMAQGASPLRLALSFAAFVMLMAAHEAGHALVARRLHVRVHAIKLFMMHGLCEFDLPEYKIDHILIAWGGVLAQAVVFAVVFLLDLSLAHVLPYADAMLQPMLVVFIPVNCFVAMFNLIPLKGLDGFLAWRIVPWLWNALWSRTQPRMRSLGGVVDLRKQRAIRKKSKVVTDELIDRLRNK
jgi:Zn-dependent protease